MARAGKRIVGLIGFAAGISLASAADPASGAPADVVAPAGSLVETTQRELEDLSTWQRGAGDTPSSAAAALALPALQAPLAVEAPTPGRPSPKEQQRALEELKRRRAARNWLLEAMRAPAADKASTSAQARQAREEALAELWTESGQTGGEPSLDVVSEALREADAADVQEAPLRGDALRIDNPLDAFLRSWMTPRDFALLGADAGDPGSGGALVPMAGGDREPAAPVHSATLAGTGVNPASRNPYLQDLPAPDTLSLDVPFSAGSLNPVTSPSVLPAPVLPIAAPPLPSARTAAETMPPPPAPDTRYQPPPSVDQKYFPQLKRF